MTLRPFHQASWNEPIILEMTSPGERGLLVPEVEDESEKRGRRPARRHPGDRSSARVRRRFPS